MFFAYIADNFITLLMIFSLMIIMLINMKGDDPIPGTRHLFIALILLLIVTITSMMDSWCADPEYYSRIGISDEMAPKLRTFFATTTYILRPAIIMI